MLGRFGTGVDRQGFLDPIHFQTGHGAWASDADMRFVYDIDDDKFRSEADGSGAGAAVLIAILTGPPHAAARLRRTDSARPTCMESGWPGPIANNHSAFGRR